MARLQHRRVGLTSSTNCTAGWVESLGYAATLARIDHKAIRRWTGPSTSRIEDDRHDPRDGCGGQQERDDPRCRRRGCALFLDLVGLDRRNLVCVVLRGKRSRRSHGYRYLRGGRGVRRLSLLRRGTVTTKAGTR